MPSSLADRLRPSLDAIRKVAGNPGLLRLQLGSLAWMAAEGAYVVGLLVLAFEAGGTGAVAFVAVLRALPSVVLAPLILSLTDRLARDRLLRLVVLARVGLVVVATVLVVTGAAPAWIYLLAAIDAVAAALLRPLRATLVPALARSAEELIAANVATSTGDSLAALLGPAVAAVLLVGGDVAATFVAGTVTMALALAAVARLHAADSVVPRRADADAPKAAQARRPSPVEAVRELLGLRHARVIVALFAGQRLIRGMLAVLVVAASFDILGIGDPGVGLLTAAIGLGGLLGGAVALALVGRRRLAIAFLAGILAWGGGIALAGVVPQVLFVLAVLAVAGIGKVVLDVSGTSLIQRTVPNSQRSRVFGLLEGVVAASLAAGPVVAALLVDALGAPGALVVAGAIPIVLAVAAWPVLKSADDAAVVPEPEMRLLSGVAMFRPLQLTTIEELADHLVRQSVDPGTEVIRQGDRPGQAFFIVESGRLEAIVDGRVTRQMTAGDSFGEIALLLDTVRTATVRAIEPSVVVRVDRGPFLAAVASTGESSAAAEAVVRARLAGT